jgi:hypothetical protein
MNVSSANSEGNTHSERLRKDYKGAFDEWALQVNRLQAIAGSPSQDLKEAEDRTAAAEIAYRNSRDRLTDDMGWTPSSLVEAGVEAGAEPGVEPALK